MILENNRDFNKAIAYLISLLPAYKLVQHVWEDGSSNHYIGYFLAEYPEKLDTYKLRDFRSPNAYHLCRSWIDSSEVDFGGYSINSKYKVQYEYLKSKYPDLDDTMQLEGEVVVPKTNEVIDYLNENGIGYEEYNAYIYPKIVIDNSRTLTDEISVNTFLNVLDDNDKPIIAKRLYDISGGDADRWVEYRLDNKSTSPLIDFGKLIKPDDNDEADWWKK